MSERAAAYACDVRDSARINAVVADVLERFGRIDVLVNNAGVNVVGLVEELDDDRWDFCFDVNVGGTFRMCRAVIPAMKAQNSGRIINAASFAAIVPSVGCAAYAASKAAVVQLTRTLAGEVGPWNITANAYAPGMIPTAMNGFADLDAAAQDRLLDTLSLRRWGEPAEVAELICFLASDAARYITGTLVDVSGGKLATQLPRRAYQPLPAVNAVASDRVLWVTGAGSGIGRAAAVAAARSVSRVALSGRRPDSLHRDRTAGDRGRMPAPAAAPRCPRSRGGAAGAPADRRRRAGGQRSGARRRSRMLRSGTGRTCRCPNSNALWPPTSPQRFPLIDVVLPGLRARGGGQIVVVSSYAAWRFSPHAGVAYSASKTALAAICASLNVQEAESGIRACHLCPGDVDTDFLDLRPQVPDADARK